MTAAVEGPLPVSHETEPLRGWRWVRTKQVEGRVLAASIIDHVGGDWREASAHPVLFGPESDAVCQRKPHPAPALRCRCGFWSVPERRLLEGAVGVRLSGWALAEVELSGTVIEAERGLRAGHQRILSLTFPDRCEHPECGERSTGLAVTSRGFLRSGCEDHGGELTLVEAAGLLGTETSFGVLSPAPSSDYRQRPALISGTIRTLLGAVAGAPSVGAGASRSGGSAAVSAAIALGVVVATLTGVGVALRAKARHAGPRWAPRFDVLATLVALTCLAVSATAMIASTSPPA